jgi:hypothetical protein
VRLGFKSRVESAAEWRAGDGDRRVTTRFGGINRGDNQVKVVPYDVPRARRQLDQCDAASHEVLLVGDVSVAGDQDVEACFLRGPEQIAIYERFPSHLPGDEHIVVGQGAAQAKRRVLVE